MRESGKAKKHVSAFTLSRLVASAVLRFTASPPDDIHDLLDRAAKQFM
jgi:hypothetical protein